MKKQKDKKISNFLVEKYNRIKIKITKEDVKRLFELFIIILIFFSSTLVATRTTALYDMRASYTNVEENILLANYSEQYGSEEEVEKYQTIAKMWFERAEGYRNLANHRTAGLIVSGYSLLFYTIALIMMLFNVKRFWIIPFMLAVFFLVLSIPVVKTSFDYDLITQINIFRSVGLFEYCQDEIVMNNTWLVQ